ncbi:hypothetical protein ACFQ1S_09145 [Kibdelosporangium lantanae]|uniref:Uncharacterized protein n=1 Tax=Kibdelosporangium lantanae TaxID=1497396 RepID=A0ABW3M807_9PSEU
MARPDGMSCTAYSKNKACDEKMLPGGIRAIWISEYRSAGKGFIFTQRRDFVFAARANGSYVLVYSDDGVGGSVVCPQGTPPRWTRTA